MRRARTFSRWRSRRHRRKRRCAQLSTHAPPPTQDIFDASASGWYVTNGLIVAESGALDVLLCKVFAVRLAALSSVGGVGVVLVSKELAQGCAS